LGSAVLRRTQAHGRPVQLPAALGECGKPTILKYGPNWHRDPRSAGRVEDEGHVFVAELEGEAAGRVVALANPLTVALMCEYSKVKEQKGARTDAPGARVEMWVC